MDITVTDVTIMQRYKLIYHLHKKSIYCARNESVGVLYID